MEKTKIGIKKELLLLIKNEDVLGKIVDTFRKDSTWQTRCYSFTEVFVNQKYTQNKERKVRTLTENLRFHGGQAHEHTFTLSK